MERTNKEYWVDMEEDLNGDDCWCVTNGGHFLWCKDKASAEKLLKVMQECLDV